MLENQNEMTAEDVLNVIHLLTQNGIEIIIDGGWAVDALLGKQTRPHQDLDLAVFHKDVPKIRTLFEERGYQEVIRDDSWECNFVLGDNQGHLIDFHSCTFDGEGNNNFGVKYPYESLQGSGIIADQPVSCIPPDWLVKFRTDYELDNNDYQDVKLLCRKFDIPIPEEFEDFVRNYQKRQTVVSKGQDMVKINIIGTSGSGKSTFGKKLAESLSLPFLEMDAIFWGPDWTFPEDKELFSKLASALEGENWVLDGNYTRTIPLKWDNIDIVIWLDFSFIRTLFQAVTRAVTRILTREEFWPGTGNRETLGKLFSRDSIVLWTLKTYRRNRKKFAGYMEADKFKKIRFIRLKSPGQAKIFLQKVSQNQDWIFDRIN